MKQVLFLIIYLSFINLISAQPTFNNAYRVASDSTFYTEFGSIVATDSAYYISGVTHDTLHGYYINRGMLMKIDTNGNKVWSRVYGDTIHTTETWYDAMITTNQGYLANVGYNFDGSSFLLVVDYNGNIIVNKNYDSQSPNIRIAISGVTQDNSNNFYLLGTYADSLYNKVLLIKTDSLGNEIWRQFYNTSPYDATVNDIFHINDTELIIACTKDLNDYQDFSYELGTWIFKIDSAGTFLNEYHTPTNRWIRGIAITITEDKNILFYNTEGVRVTGTNPNIPSYNYVGYIGKLDNNLQLVWEKRYGTKWSQFSHIKEKDNGHLIVTGSLYSDLSLDSVRLTGWIMELDENGDSLWQREHIIFSGIRQWHTLGDFEFLDDGKMIMSGYIENWTPNDGNARRYWGWLIRTDSFGCIVPGCQLLDNTENVAVIFDNEVVVYPNPASEVVRFRFEKAVQDAVIRVYSGLGQLVGETALNHSDMAQINVSNWHSGMYFYGVYVEGVLVKQGQVLVQK
jgi:hypothetical protein